MPAWNDLLTQMDVLPQEKRTAWLLSETTAVLKTISEKRGKRNVLLYGSAFLQKPQLPGQSLQITFEEISGIMSVLFGMPWGRHLTLILHSPGGVTNAAETLVAYLWSKFRDIEVIVPTFAMSAGTMISLAANRLVMGRQSQLGPIDPQIPLGGMLVSARAIVD